MLIIANAGKLAIMHDEGLKVCLPVSACSSDVAARLAADFDLTIGVGRVGGPLIFGLLRAQVQHAQ